MDCVGREVGEVVREMKRRTREKDRDGQWGETVGNESTVVCMRAEHVRMLRRGNATKM